MFVQAFAAYDCPQIEGIQAVTFRYGATGYHSTSSVGFNFIEHTSPYIELTNEGVSEVYLKASLDSQGFSASSLIKLLPNQVLVFDSVPEEGLQCFICDSEDYIENLINLCHFPIQVS
jgi:hypothetical protein